MERQIKNKKEIKEAIKNEVSPLLIGVRNDLKEVGNAIEFFVKNLDYVKGDKGDDGKSAIRGIDYWTIADKKEIIKNATPIKGKDYFTKKEIKDFLKEVTPIKGKHYNDGLNAKAPVRGIDYFTDSEIKDFLNQCTPIKGIHYRDGIDGITKTEITYRPLDGVAVRDVLEELKGNARLSVKAIKGIDELIQQALGSKGNGGIGGSGGSGGSISLTPWTSDIDGGYFALLNTSLLQTDSLTNNDSGAPLSVGHTSGTFTSYSSSGTVTDVSDFGGSHSLRVGGNDILNITLGRASFFNDMAYVDSDGAFTATSITKAGGASNEFLMADGTTNGATYLDSSIFAQTHNWTQYQTFADSATLVGGTNSFSPIPTTISSRNNFTGALGFKFSVSSNITVTRLGRLYVSGNTQDHVIKLWISTNTTTALRTATILNSSTSDQYGYKWVSITPITLVTGNTYRIAIDETNGGDTWSDSGARTWQSVFTSTGAAFTGTQGAYPANDGAASQSYDLPAMDYSIVSTVDNNIYTTNLTVTSLTKNEIVFAGAGGKLSHRNGFVWDDTNLRLGINVVSPTSAIDVLTSGVGVKLTLPEGQSPFEFYRSSDNQKLFWVGFPGSGIVDLNNTYAGLRLYGATGITLRNDVIIGGENPVGTPCLRVRQVGSQTADMQRWTDNGGSTIYAKIDVAGNFTGKSLTGTAVTYANRPSSPVHGMLVAISDSTVNTFGATIAGGGANKVLGFYNGTNWTVAGI